MSGELYALLQRVHGHLAMLGTALLLHPVITLTRRSRTTLWTVRTADLAALLLALPFALGWWIYPEYRHQVKPELLRDAAFAAMCFESKEHLAALALFCAVSGAVALRAYGDSKAGRGLARNLLAAAFCCAVITGVLGVYVAHIAHPGY